MPYLINGALFICPTSSGSVLPAWFINIITLVYLLATKYATSSNSVTLSPAGGINLCGSFSSSVCNQILSYLSVSCLHDESFGTVIVGYRENGANSGHLAPHDGPGMARFSGPLSELMTVKHCRHNSTAEGSLRTLCVLHADYTGTGHVKWSNIGGVPNEVGLCNIGGVPNEVRLCNIGGLPNKVKWYNIGGLQIEVRLFNMARLPNGSSGLVPNEVKWYNIGGLPNRSWKWSNIGLVVSNEVNWYNIGGLPNLRLG